MNEIVYAGRLFYEPSRIHAAAVYCSDGRLGDHFDDFLQNGLHLPRYDRLALPGGPAALVEDEPVALLAESAALLKDEPVASRGGSASSLAAEFAAWLRESCRSGSGSAWEALAFLVEAHELKRVLLIAHEGCAFYVQRVGLENDGMEAVQRRDLARAAARIQASAPHLQIDAYFARIGGNRIVFEPSSLQPSWQFAGPIATRG